MSANLEIEHLLLERPIPVYEIVKRLAKASLLADPDDISTVKQIAYLDDVLEEQLAYPAMSLLPAWGESGIDILCMLAVDGPHYGAAFTILSTISLGRVPVSDDVFFIGERWDSIQKYSLAEGLPQYAQKRLREIIVEHLADPDKKSKLLYSIASQSFFQHNSSTKGERLDFFVELLLDTHMLLSRSILRRFEKLLESSPAREEELHQFLLEHPVILDPFVTELRTKHELGDDFITDFVIRRINDEYVVVEIENSTDRIFNRNGAFSYDLMTAIAQVRDFQAWIADNIAYTRQKLPGIHHPEGLVVTGRRTELGPVMERRLSEENFSRRGHIKVLTYDDLLSQAWSVYTNTIERPVILHSKDQRSI